MSRGTLNALVAVVGCGFACLGLDRLDLGGVARARARGRGWALATSDERSVAILWLMQNPLYGQLDAGAIWNRTFNEFVTRQGATSGTSSSHAAEIEAVQA